MTFRFKDYSDFEEQQYKKWNKLDKRQEQNENSGSLEQDNILLPQEQKNITVDGRTPNLLSNAQTLPAALWQRVLKRWDAYSLRRKLSILFLAGAALPMFAATTAVVAIAANRLNLAAESSVGKDLLLLNQELAQLRLSNTETASAMAGQIQDAGIDPSDRDDAKVARDIVSDWVHHSSHQQSFLLITDKQGKTIAQSVQIFGNDFSNNPPLPGPDKPLLEPRYHPISLPLGINLGSLLAITKDSLHTGRSLSGTELLSSEQIERLGLEKQGEIGFRGQSQDSDDKREPYADNTFFYDHDDHALVEISSVPVRARGKIVGTVTVGTLLNRNYQIVDAIQQKTGAKAALLVKDYQIATNAVYPGEQTRAIGTRASKEVVERVLNGKQTFVGPTKLVSLEVLAGVAPLYDHQHQLNPLQAKPVGMAYVAQPESRTLTTLALVGYGLGGAILLGLGLVAVQIAGSFTRPIRRLADFAYQSSYGYRGLRLETTDRRDEIGVLAQELNLMALKLDSSRSENRDQMEKHRQTELLLFEFSSISLKLQQFLSVEQLFYEAVNLIRFALRAERVIICRSNLEGENIAAESVMSGEILAERVEFYSEVAGSEYRVKLTSSSILPEVVVPISVNNQVFGFMIVCKSGRVLEGEIEQDLLKQSAAILGIALEKILLTEDLEQTRIASETRILALLHREQDRARELAELLSDFEGASTGNLVRPDLSAIGNSNDLFNSKIENLRQLASQIKTGAGEVENSLSSNARASALHASAAQNHAIVVAQTLEEAERMCDSIQQAAEDTRNAAVVARETSLEVASETEKFDQRAQNLSDSRLKLAEIAKKIRRFSEAKVERLTELSDQLRKAVLLIKKIAQDTQILSVNARIEAQKAGESAGGFMIVNGEISRVAAYSTEATNEIEEIVADVRKEIAEIAAEIERDSKGVAPTQRSETYSGSFKQMLTVSRKYEQLLQSMESRIEAHAQITRLVIMLMRRSGLDSQTNSDNSQQLSVSIQCSLDLMRQLQASVNNFKLVE